jgi:tetratricopeptide (TPR) repeat protein
MAIVRRLDELVAQIQSDRKKLNKIDEILPISFFDTNDQPDYSSSKLNGTFLYSQLLIDALLQLKENPTDKNELISVCKSEFEGNKEQLDILEEFENDYSQKKALWWYTRNSCLYRVLNKALRVQNLDMLFLFQFFIRDLQTQLRDLQREQTSSITKVYRGQVMGDDEIHQFETSFGQLMSMNSFLSTSRNREQATVFLDSLTVPSHLQRVLLEIDIHPDIVAKTPFADISSRSYYHHEQEVLFMPGTIFKISYAGREDGLFTIILSLANVDDDHLTSLFEHMKREIAEESDLIAFGKMLRRSGKLKQAEFFFRRVIKSLSIRDPLCPRCFRALGNVLDGLCQFDESLMWLEKALVNFQQALPSNHPSIAHTYKSIGNVYFQTDNLKAALSAYEKALLIYKKAYGDDHQRVAMCLNNIGAVYLVEKQYSKAFEYFWKDLAISEKYLPENHPDLAIVINNIGEVHYCLGHFDLALQHFKRALKMQEKSLPHDHFHIASTYHKIGSMYKAQGKQSLSLQNYEKANTIFHKSIPSDDLDIQQDAQVIKSKLK